MDRTRRRNLPPAAHLAGKALSHEVKVNLRGIEHTIRLPLVKPPTEIHIDTHPSDRDNDNRFQRYGMFSSALFHACGLAAILWWPASPVHQLATISGQRSVASIQLAFSTAAIAGEPEPLEVLETALTEVSPPKTEMIELLLELETEEVVIVEEPSLSESTEQTAEETAEKPVEQETTTQQGTAPMNSHASQSSVVQHLGFDDTSPRFRMNQSRCRIARPILVNL